MKMNQMTLNRGNNMAKSDRRKKSNKECTIDIGIYNERVRLFIQSSDKVFEQLGSWGCKWTDISIGVLDNMQEAYEAVESAKRCAAKIAESLRVADEAALAEEERLAAEATRRTEAIEQAKLLSEQAESALSECEKSRAERSGALLDDLPPEALKARAEGDDAFSKVNELCQEANRFCEAAAKQETAAAAREKAQQPPLPLPLEPEPEPEPELELEPGRQPVSEPSSVDCDADSLAPNSVAIPPPVRLP